MKTISQQYEALTNEDKYNEGAELIANHLNLKMRVVSTRFESMNWDTNGQKRNIFKIELSKDKEKYTLDFGSSLQNSVKPSNKWEQMKDSEQIEVYAGRMLVKSKVSGSVKIPTTRGEIENMHSDTILQWAELLKMDFNDNIAEYNKKQRTKYEHLNGFRSVGSAVDTIKKAIQRKIDELKNESALSNEQLSEVKEPSFYDVLTCLQKYDVGTFEDFCGDFGYDEDSRKAEKTYKAVVKEFQAMECLFTSDELELLQEIQ